MDTRITVHVPKETLSDAKHQQGANFKPSICSLLDDGYAVEIETPSDTMTFNSAADFTTWFEGTEPAHGEFPGPADDDLDADD
jgi:hypothetical protein